MSLKDLFESTKTTQSSSADKVSYEAESEAYVEAYIVDKNTFVPSVDFSTASNFARYGSAEKYYTDSIERITNTYPYDGSRAEKVEFQNSSSYLDRWIFENRYPKSTGYVSLGTTSGSGDWLSMVSSSDETVGGYGMPDTTSNNILEYIEIKAGPHTGSADRTFETHDVSSKKLFTFSNVYDSGSAREYNMEFDLRTGVTVEFWLLKNDFYTSKTEREVIFDLWNNENSSSAGYGRLMIELTGGADAGSAIRLTAQSGTSGFINQPIATITPSDVADGVWKHYAITLKNDPDDDGVNARLFVNGQVSGSSKLGSAALGRVTGSITANLGALRAPPSGATGYYDTTTIAKGGAKLSASLDEFRYWKLVRDAKQIGRYWHTQIAGGTNTDLSNVGLGVYYKFNEGVMHTASRDATVLDYSGRISNGWWRGGVAEVRNTGSAMTSGSHNGYEFHDPIIYRAHPEVSGLRGELAASGSTHDNLNPSKIAAGFPSWTSEEGAEESETLSELTQIMGSYFDKLHLQIEAMGKIKERYSTAYTQNAHSASYKPIPFADKLVSQFGIATPELLQEAEFIENFLHRNEKKEYAETLADTRNQIYTNIYANLLYIFKSKGTEKSFRNMLRCFGVDDELVKLNVYSDQSDYVFKDNRRSTSNKTNYVSFSHPDRFQGTVYQAMSMSVDGVYDNPHAAAYITGSASGSAFGAYNPQTIECEVFFPLKDEPTDSTTWFQDSFFTASLFGAMGTVESTTDTRFPTDDGVDLRVMAIKDRLESKRAYFQLSSSNLGVLTSSYYEDIYDDTRWNFAVRVKPSKYPWQDQVSGSSSAATAAITTTGGPLTGETFTLTDAAGLAVGFIFKRAVTTVDGTKDGDNVIIGVNGALGSAASVGERIRDAINASDVAIAATEQTGPLRITLTQAAHGTAGNTSIDMSGVTTVTATSFNAGLDNSFDVEFYGVNMFTDLVQNEFSVSTTVSEAVGKTFLSSSKRCYAGALHQDFTSSTVLHYSNVDVGNLRYWMSYIPDNVVLAHAMDESNYGTTSPYENAFVYQSAMSGVYVPQLATLALHWNFDNVTGSGDSPTTALNTQDAQFIVHDMSSGSADHGDRYKEEFSPQVRMQHLGIGDFFLDNKTNVVNTRYIPTAKMVLPEYLYSSDMVEIRRRDDEFFTRETRPSKVVYALEKSMYQTISEEMINMFATLKDFDNLIGEPVNRYRHEYKDLAKLRQLFFERIGNTPDLDKYVDYYKWVDGAVSRFLEQLMPASAYSSEGLRTMVESHILERNKYQTKFPSMEFHGDPPIAGAEGINKLLYDYQRGRAPLPRDIHSISSVEVGSTGSAEMMDDNENCLWWSRRADREHPILAATALRATSGSANDLHHSGTLASRTGIFSASAQTFNRQYTTPYKYSVHRSTIIHGGINYDDIKKLDYVYPATVPFSPRPLDYHIYGGFPLGYLLAKDMDKDASPSASLPNCDTPTSSSYGGVVKREGYKVIDGWETFKSNAGGQYVAGGAYTPDWGSGSYTTFRGNLVMPFNVISSSTEDVNAGYTALINQELTVYTGTGVAITSTGSDGTYTHKIGQAYFDPPSQITTKVGGLGRGVNLVNLHTDTYGEDKELPLQGPFTEKYVGGRRYRHADVNDGTHTIQNREEGFLMLISTAMSYSDGVIDATSGGVGLVGPDYPYPHGPYPFAQGDATNWRPIGGRYYRDETAKRPVNIRNIQMKTASAGDYYLYPETQNVGRHKVVNIYAGNSKGVTWPASGDAAGDVLYVSASIYGPYTAVTNTVRHVHSETPDYSSNPFYFSGSNAKFTYSTWLWMKDDGTNRRLITMGSAKYGPSGEYGGWTIDKTANDFLSIRLPTTSDALQEQGQTTYGRHAQWVTATGSMTLNSDESGSYLTDNEGWWHLAVTYDATQGGTSGSDGFEIDTDAKPKVYLNGTEQTVTTNIAPAKFVIEMTSSHAFRKDSSNNALNIAPAVVIGGNISAPASYEFSGSIDDITIWNRPLSQGEVRELMGNGGYYSHPNTASGGPPFVVRTLAYQSDTGSLLAWWRMGDHSSDHSLTSQGKNSVLFYDGRNEYDTDRLGTRWEDDALYGIYNLTAAQNSTVATQFAYNTQPLTPATGTADTWVIDYHNQIATGSARTIIGNYRKNYEVVHTVGRSVQKPFLRDNQSVRNILQTGSFAEVSGNVNTAGVSASWSATTPTNIVELPATTHVETFLTQRHSFLPNSTTGDPQHLSSTDNTDVFVYNYLADPHSSASVADGARVIVSAIKGGGAGTDDQHVYMDFEVQNRASSSTNLDTIFANRFSAPGGPRNQSKGFLDLAAEEYSVYNAYPWRNLEVLGSSSGEQYNISASTHDMAAHPRLGLQSLRRLPMGRFGLPTVTSGATAGTYDTQASWHKVNRNPSFGFRSGRSDEEADLDPTSVARKVAIGNLYSTLPTAGSTVIIQDATGSSHHYQWKNSVDDTGVDVTDLTKAGTAADPYLIGIHTTASAIADSAANITALGNAIKGTTGFGVSDYTNRSSNYYQVIILTYALSGTLANSIDWSNAAEARNELGTWFTVDGGAAVGEQGTSWGDTQMGAGALPAVVDRWRYDNDYVTRPIPQNDYQYAWISASLAPSGSDSTLPQLGYGYHLSSLNIPTLTGSRPVDPILFNSASDAGSAIGDTDTHANSDDRGFRYFGIAKSLGYQDIPNVQTLNLNLREEQNTWLSDASGAVALGFFASGGILPADDKQVIGANTNDRRGGFAYGSRIGSLHNYLNGTFLFNDGRESVSGIGPTIHNSEKIHLQGAFVGDSDGTSPDLWDNEKIRYDVTPMYWSGAAGTFTHENVDFTPSSTDHQHYAINQSVASIFNSLMWKRNGPYGYPTWKQIRTGEHILARTMRENNRYVLVDPQSDRVENPAPGFVGRRRYKSRMRGKDAVAAFKRLGHINTAERTHHHYYVPVVDRSSKSMITTIQVGDFTEAHFSPGLGTMGGPEGTHYSTTEDLLYVKSTYQNNLKNFPINKLNTDVGLLNYKSERTVFDDLYEMYTEKTDINGDNAYTLVSLIYRETIFPRAKNVGRAGYRSRARFDAGFWAADDDAEMQHLDDESHLVDYDPVGRRTYFDETGDPRSPRTAFRFHLGPDASTYYWSTTDTIYSVFHNQESKENNVQYIEYSASVWPMDGGSINLERNSTALTDRKDMLGARAGGVDGSLEAAQFRASGSDALSHNRGFMRGRSIEKAHTFGAPGILQNQFTWFHNGMKYGWDPTNIADSTRIPVVSSSTVSVNSYQNIAEMIGNTRVDPAGYMVSERYVVCAASNIAFGPSYARPHMLVGRDSYCSPSAGKAAYSRRFNFASETSELTGASSYGKGDGLSPMFPGINHEYATSDDNDEYSIADGINSNQFCTIPHTSSIAPKPYDLGDRIVSQLTRSIGHTVEGLYVSDWKWKAPEQSGKAPFYANYSDWFEEMRGKSQDRQVLPEYRISDRIPFFVLDKQGRFKSRDSEWLSLIGNPSSSAGGPLTGSSHTAKIGSTVTSSFVSDYAITAKPALFDAIRSKHTDIAEPYQLTLTCDAVLKFLPYEGFYPQLRTVDLCKQFINSYDEHVTFKSDMGVNDKPSSFVRADSSGSIRPPKSALPWYGFNPWHRVPEGQVYGSMLIGAAAAKLQFVINSAGPSVGQALTIADYSNNTVIYTVAQANTVGTDTVGWEKMSTATTVAGAIERANAFRHAIERGDHKNTLIAYISHVAGSYVELTIISVLAGSNGNRTMSENCTGIHIGSNFAGGGTNTAHTLTTAMFYSDVDKGGYDFNLDEIVDPTSPRVGGSGKRYSSGFETHGRNAAAAKRPFYGPFMAPGILFNTIKSGIAVDYPVLNRKLATTSSVDRDGGRNYQILNEYFDNRLPFETLVEPEKYLTNVPLVDMEPHPSASMNVTASWNGQGDPLYKMMMHNFLAEVPSFFLADGKMQSFTSLPESDGNFGQVSAVVHNGDQIIPEYRMMVKVWKSQESVAVSTTPSSSNHWANHRGPLKPIPTLTHAGTPSGTMPFLGQYEPCYYTDVVGMEARGYQRGFGGALTEGVEYGAFGGSTSGSYDPDGGDSQAADDGGLWTSDGGFGVGNPIADYQSPYGQDYAKEESQYPRPQIIAPETITMYSRPSAFGPPCAGGYAFQPELEYMYTGSVAPMSMSFAAGAGSHVPGSGTVGKVADRIGTTYGMKDSTNGYNAPFTPPYYDGQAWALVTFKPTRTGKHYLDDIWENTTVNFLRYEFDYVSGAYGDWGTVGPQGYAMNVNAMQVDAAVKIKGKTQIKEVTYDALTGQPLSVSDSLDTSTRNSAWVIETKFETPILHFGYGLTDNQSAPTLSGSASGSCLVERNGYHHGYAGLCEPIGMWHQYGEIPSASQGIYLEIGDIPEPYTLHGTEMTIANPKWLQVTGSPDWNCGSTANLRTWKSGSTEYYGAVDWDGHISGTFTNSIVNKTNGILLAGEGYRFSGSFSGSADAFIVSRQTIDNPDMVSGRSGAREDNSGAQQYMRWRLMSTGSLAGIIADMTHLQLISADDGTILDTTWGCPITRTSAVAPGISGSAPCYERGFYITAEVTGSNIISGSAHAGGSTSTHAMASFQVDGDPDGTPTPPALNQTITITDYAGASQVYTAKDATDAANGQFIRSGVSNQVVATAIVLCINTLQGSTIEATAHAQHGLGTDRIILRSVKGGQAGNDTGVTDAGSANIVWSSATGFNITTGNAATDQNLPNFNYGHIGGPNLAGGATKAASPIDLQTHLNRGYPGTSSARQRLMGIGKLTGSFNDEGGPIPFRNYYSQWEHSVPNNPNVDVAALAAGYRSPLHKNKRGVIPEEPHFSNNIGTGSFGDALGASFYSHAYDNTHPYYTNKLGYEVKTFSTGTLLHLTHSAQGTAHYGPLVGGKIPANTFNTSYVVSSSVGQGKADILCGYTGSYSRRGEGGGDTPANRQLVADHIIDGPLSGTAPVFPNGNRLISGFTAGETSYQRWASDYYYAGDSNDSPANCSGSLTAQGTGGGGEKAGVQGFHADGTLPGLAADNAYSTNHLRSLEDIYPLGMRGWDATAAGWVSNSTGSHANRGKSIPEQFIIDPIEMWYSNPVHIANVRTADMNLRSPIMTLQGFGLGNPAKYLHKIQDAVGSPRTVPSGKFLPRSGIPALTRSLGSLVGFDPTAKKLGQVAEVKKVKEAVVAMPYIMVRGRRHFVELNRDQIDRYYGRNDYENVTYWSALENGLSLEGKAKSPKSGLQVNLGASVLRQMRLMEDYVLPPHLDFARNDTANPYAMYMFEFEHQFDGQDLADMWQGLYPDSGKVMKQVTKSVTHDLNVLELLGAASDTGGTKVPPQIRFMVFKIKQRAAINYFAKTSDDTDDSRFRFKFKNASSTTTPDWSYNWPYDFFSLVETTKLDMSISLKNKKLISDIELQDLSQQITMAPTMDTGESGASAVTSLASSVLESSRRMSMRASTSEAASAAVGASWGSPSVGRR